MIRNSITIRRPEKPIDVTIDLPRSKSVSNRALILASLAGDLSCVKEMSDGDDTRILHALLRDRPRVMHCGLGGTTLRFLLAWASVQQGEERIITGDARLMERPHDALMDALRSLGADIERKSDGFHVRGKRMKGGGITIDSPVSSQFISALLLIAPMMEQGLTVRWTGRKLSEPYVGMTLKALDHFGAEAAEHKEELYVLSSHRPRITPLEVPRDWSAASFWYEVVALAPDARVVLKDLRMDGWQGDERALKLWSFAVRTTETSGGMLLDHPGHDRPSLGYVMSSTPDLFLPFAFTYAGLGRIGIFGGIESLPLKETDRLAAAKDALEKFGIPVDPIDDTFAFSSSLGRHGHFAKATDQPFDPHGDHRMAMSLAPLALVCDAITILDPEVVDKSYPRFWDDLRKAGFRIEQ